MLSRCAASVNEALRACATGWPQIAAGVLLSYRYFVGQRSDRPYVLSSAKYGLRESLERLSSEPSDEQNDPYDALAVIAEEATDRAEYLYELLSDLKKQTFLGALAGLYHQWDKDLRHFVERELRHNYEKSFFHKSVWEARSEASSKCFASLGGTYHLPISSRRLTRVG